MRYLMTTATWPAASPSVPSLVKAPGMARLKTLLEFVFVLAAFSILTGSTISTGSVMDEDIWWHLRTGQWIVANHAVPVKDMFSTHAAGQPWIAYSWLFDVLVYKAFAAWGYRGMLALSTFALFAYTAGAALFLMHFTNVRRALILAFAAYIALMPLKSPRPWLCSVLFFGAELALLWMARERNRPAWLLPVVPLFALWANLHIQFVYGLGLIGLFALEVALPGAARRALAAEAAPRLRSLWLWLLLAACVFATFLNPYGWNLYRVVAQYATQSAPLTLINEMQAMPFRNVMDWMVLLLVLSAVFATGCARRKNLLLISGLAAACFFGFRSQRDVWFPVTLAILALAAAARQTGIEMARPYRGVRLRFSLWMALALSCLATSCFLSFNGRFSDAELHNAVERRFPSKAVRYIESHALQGPLFNPYRWGGYLIWRLPSMPVSIDGRANLYEASLAASSNTIRGERGWWQDPDLTNARTILLEQAGPLASVLRSDPHFHLVYEDELASVFERAKAPALR